MSTPRLLFDENFNADIISGLYNRVPIAELTTAQEQGLRKTHDSLILDWAANHGYIVVTHDMRTMPRFAYERIAQGVPMPGLMIISQQIAIRAAIDALELVLAASQAEEWVDRVVFLPWR